MSHEHMNTHERLILFLCYSDSVMLKLFPKNVHSSLDFSTISFNAVAATYITSALKKISAKESAADSGIVAANPAILDSITINANGDLRAAINNLQVAIICLIHVVCSFRMLL